MKRLLFVVIMMTCSLSWAAWEKTGTIVDGDEVRVTTKDCDQTSATRNACRPDVAETDQRVVCVATF